MPQTPPTAAAMRSPTGPQSLGLPPLGTPPSGAAQAGFTVIELVVVAVVMATVTAVVAVGIGNIRGASVQAESGKLSVAVRYLYNLSVLNQKVYRLVIDMDSGSYWAEAQQSRDPCKSFELPDEDTVEAAAEGKTDEDPDKHGGGSFGGANNKLVKKRKLDKGVDFSGVMTSSRGDLAESGTAHIHFFPNGTVERAFIFIRNHDDEEDVMTVEIMPLQGSARIHRVQLEIDAFFEGG